MSLFLRVIELGFPDNEAIDYEVGIDYEKIRRIVHEEVEKEIQSAIRGIFEAVRETVADMEKKP